MGTTEPSKARYDRRIRQYELYIYIHNHIYIHMSIYNMHTNVCILYIYIYIHIVLTGSIRKHRKTARLGNVSTAQKWDVTTNKHLEVESTIIPVVF